MYWHTTQTQTNTFPPHWGYWVLMVAPMYLVLNYQLKPYYILDSCLTKKSKPPE